jgi:hypothetical protein
MDERDTLLISNGTRRPTEVTSFSMLQDFYALCNRAIFLQNRNFTPGNFPKCFFSRSQLHAIALINAISLSLAVQEKQNESV